MMVDFVCHFQALKKMARPVSIKPSRVAPRAVGLTPNVPVSAHTTLESDTPSHGGGWVTQCSE